MIRSPLDRLSIELRLPLLISSLLVLVILWFSLAAYNEVRRSALDAAAERLELLTKQLDDLVRAGMRQRVAEIREAAGQPVWQTYLRRPADVRRAAALEALQRFSSAGRLPGTVELWNAAGERLLSVGPARPPFDGTTARALRESVSGSVRAAVGPFHVVDDSLFLSYIAAIGGGGEGPGEGYLVERRRVVGSRQGAQQLAGLVGSDATLLIGNVTGDVWTNFYEPVEGPPIPAPINPGMLEYARPGRGRFLARATPIAGTPWLLVIDFPRDRILARAQSFLGRIVAIALVLIPAGALGAWAVSRQITQPLRALSNAAETIAAGRHAARVDIGRTDELGGLARSFNTMADRIEEARQRLETQVAEVGASEARLSAIVRAALDAHITMDEAGTITGWNPQAEAVFGWPASEVLGRPLADVVVPPMQREAHWRGLRRFLATGEGPILNQRLELTAIRRDGREFPAELAVTPIRVGNAWLFSAFLRDNTEGKQLQQRLMQSQKMEAVGRLAGGVAHDFNNLLTAIFGYADLMTEALPAGDRARQDLAEIRKAADRAASLTRQLLAFSRQQVLAPTVLNLNEVVEGVVKMLERLIGEDITLRTALAPDLGNVRADAGQLEQVILNLALNARDAMPTGGKLTIETMNAELSAEYADAHQPVVPGAYVMLAVSDTGIGMDQETRIRIFEPFFTTKEKGKGTGLGLATVYGIVKQSGGYIWAYSEPGHGATFKAYLPLVDAPVDATPPAREAGTLAGGETIVLAEDDALLRPLARGILERLGYTVLAAANAEEALARSRDHRGPIHLLMADVVMPGASGRDLARRLAELRPEARVLYVSGYTDDAIVHHGVLEPGLQYLQKPFTPAALGRKVREVLDAPPK